jgi:hypothetical protein
LTISELDKIIDPEKDISDSIDKSNRFFATLIEPLSFNNESNFEIAYEKEFESNCIRLSEYSKQPIKTLTVKEYFSLLEYHNQKNPPKGKQINFK